MLTGSAGFLRTKSLNIDWLARVLVTQFLRQPVSRQEARIAIGWRVCAFKVAKASIVAGLALMLTQGIAVPADGSDAKTLREISRELKQLERDRALDLEEIERLKQRMGQLESENTQLKASATQITTQQSQTTQQVKQLQQQTQAEVPSAQFSNLFGRYLGTHTFTVTGAAGGDFIYDQQSAALDGVHHQAQNTFLFDWEPMVLYRPTDWILFQGVISTRFGRTGAGASLSTADFQLFLNDHMTVVAGLFDQPFGDWLEDQSPMWVNRFVTAPLPFAVEPLVPPSEIGVQVRGGMQWGALGQDFDYTVWGGNGPSFSQSVPGAALGGPVAVASSQTNGKSMGGRFRIYPFPVDSNLGRLELGASTYNGKWFDGKWFNSWGVDFNYFKGNFQSRGEWIQAYREMPRGLSSDNRQGWYIQLGYFLNGINLPFFSDQLNNYVQRLEPLVRYSGVNQRGVATDDITGATGIGAGGLQAGLIPDFGLSGSPVLFAPHSREVALGLDYWIAPSIVWQNEFDIELPHAGGVFVAGNGATSPVGSVPNDRAFLSQLTIGF